MAHMQMVIELTEPIPRHLGTQRVPLRIGGGKCLVERVPERKGEVGGHVLLSKGSNLPTKLAVLRGSWLSGAR